MYTREKHPINDLVNADMVEDIFLELEDTSNFDVIVQDVMGKPRNRKMVQFYELERDNDVSFEEEFQYHRLKAVDRKYEVTTLYKVAIITPSVISKSVSSWCISNLINNIDVMEVTERVKDYLGEELTYILKNDIALDMSGHQYRNIETGEKIDGPVIAIYFNSYESKKYTR